MKKGFTLIELLITIGLIGIIATASVALINPAAQFKKANDGRRKADLSKLQAGFELYRADQGGYPPSASVNTSSCAGSLIVAGITYIKVIPCDPKNSSPYVYTYTPASPASSYELVACLENDNDPEKDASNNPLCTQGSVSYTLSNP